MPNYHNLPVLTDLGKIVTLHAKKPLKEDEGKLAVETVLKKYAKLGVENAKLRLAYAKSAHDECKQVLASMEKLLEDLRADGYVPEIYKLGEIKGGLDIIQLKTKAVHDDGATMYDLMKEYRENWTATVAKVCKETGFVDTYIAIRTQTMTVGKQAVAQVERCDEYLKRAELVYKTAQKVRAGVESTVGEIKEEADELLKDIETAETEAGKLVKPALAKVKSLESNKTMKTYTGKEHKVSESFVQDVETNRKAVAGRLKTATKQGERLRELIKQKSFLLGGHGKRLDTALNALQGHRDAMEKAAEDAKDAFDDLKKRVGQK